MPKIQDPHTSRFPHNVAWLKHSHQYAPCTRCVIDIICGTYFIAACSAIYGWLRGRCCTPTLPLSLAIECIVLSISPSPIRPFSVSLSCLTVSGSYRPPPSMPTNPLQHFKHQAEIPVFVASLRFFQGDLVVFSRCQAALSPVVSGRRDAESDVQKQPRPCAWHDQREHVFTGLCCRWCGSSENLVNSSFVTNLY